MVVGEFQSTHPLRGATGRDGHWHGSRTISIHAPLAGCDVLDCIQTRVTPHFNPRTPCGVRRRICAINGGNKKDFNPRTPCGVRPYSSIKSITKLIFQSTHPLRGATKDKGFIGRRIAISIHAPLAGCDGPWRRAPGRSGRISIHAPLAGCDFSPDYSPTGSKNFNPRTPCGVRHRDPQGRSYPRDFNPRTPCGVRHFRHGTAC